METYSAGSKLKMDLADATLYWVADETGIREIMTTDIRDFSRNDSQMVNRSRNCSTGTGR